MKKLFVLVSAIIIAIPSFSQNNTDKRLKGIEKEFARVLETFDAPGFGVAVVEKDKIIYSAGFGYRDYENKLRVDENTLFAIGSCTKSFTASLLGILEEDGDISIDNRPAEYIPGFRFFNDEMNNSITIRDMMCHRTGLPRHDFSWYYFPGESKESLLRKVEYQEPFAGVRERWYYNNYMYLAQGVIAEKITGKSWEENVREKIFGPLGMTRSNLTIDELENSDNAAFGYELTSGDKIKRMDYYDIDMMSPAGSINSSAREMTSWLRTWINSGKFGGEEIIPENFVTQAISSQMVISAALPDKEDPDMHFSNYGFAWFLSSYKGHYRVQHGGNIDGFSANTCFFPSDSIGIVVLVNQNASVVPTVVRNILADRMLGVDRDDWTTVMKKRRDQAGQAQEQTNKEEARKKGTSFSHELPEYAGTYSNKGYGEFKIEFSGDSLFAKFPLNEYWLRHYHYDSFEPVEIKNGTVDTSDVVDIRFDFKTNTVGDLSGLEVQLEATLPSLFFKRTPPEVEMEKEDMQKYTGDYELGGVTVKVYLKDDILYVFVPGQPEYEMLSTGNHKFTFKVLDGYSVEFEEDDETITGMKFIQPNGIFSAKKR